MPDEEKTRIQPWSPPSDADYDSLTLRGKIREHQILANEAAVRAGPMFRSGKHLTADEMSDDWRRLRAKAANHHAEVKRLGEKLAEARTT